MAWYDDYVKPIALNPITAPIVGAQGLYDTFIGNDKQKAKEAEEARLYATPSGPQMQAEIAGATNQGKVLGRRRGEELFGQESTLSPISQDILKRRQDLSQGLNAQELSAARAQGRGQINTDTQSRLAQLRSIQGKQGIKGGMAASQQVGVLGSGADQQRNLERDLIVKNYEARNAGLQKLQDDVNSRLFGIQGMESAGVNQALAEQSLSKGLAISSIPAPQPKPGILSSSFGNLTVICTEMKRQGMLDEKTQQADSIYGLLTINHAPHVYVGYITWAKHVAAYMAKSPKFSRMIAKLAVPWAHHMAFSLGYRKEDSKLGRLVNDIGYPLCGILGKLILKFRRIAHA